MNTARRGRPGRDDTLSQAVQRICNGCARHDAVGVDDEEVMVMSDGYDWGRVVSMGTKLVGVVTILCGKNNSDDVAALDIGVGPFIGEAEEELSAGAEIYSSDELSLARYTDVEDGETTKFERYGGHHGKGALLCWRMRGMIVLV